MLETPSQARDVDIFSRWLDHWSRPPFGWAAFAANLANQAPDYLAGHSFWLMAQERNGYDRHSSRAAFEVMDAGMISDAQIEESLAKFFPFEESILAAFKALPASTSTVRWVVMCETSCYMSNSAAMELDELFLEGSAARIADRCSISARSMAAALKIVWETEFKICVRLGNDGWTCLITKKASQAYSSLRQTESYQFQSIEMTGPFTWSPSYLVALFDAFNHMSDPSQDGSQPQTPCPSANANIVQPYTTPKDID
ncbi:hypothetical protein B0H13DRAFT_1897480 [Mycena leptocephala]|nr:hypothetical protein B0H13DRAFT_1897480 [Mycena leptocephala]